VCCEAQARKLTEMKRKPGKSKRPVLGNAKRSVVCSYGVSGKIELPGGTAGISKHQCAGAGVTLYTARKSINIVI